MAMMRKWLLVHVLLLALLCAPALGASVKVEDEPAVEDEAAHTMHSEDEVREAQEEFQSIDMDGDGFITEDEILSMEDVPERDEIDEFFETYDLDGDHKVSFEEILQADEAMQNEEEADIERES